MTYAQALALAYDRQLFGAQAYNLARVPGETRSAKDLYLGLLIRGAYAQRGGFDG